MIHMTHLKRPTYSLTYICVETDVTHRLGNGTTTSPSNPTSLLGTWVCYNRPQQVYVKNVPETVQVSIHNH